MTEQSIEERLFEVEERSGDTPLADLSPTRRVFMLIWRLEAEVNNGGFEQYFANKDDGPMAAGALRAIGASSCAAIVARAVAVAERAGMDWSVDEFRAATVAGFSDEVRAELDGLDRAFLDYPESLSHLLFAYVSEHPADFP